MFKNIALLLVTALFFTFSACSLGVKDNTAISPMRPMSHTCTAPYDKVWNAAIKVLGTNGVFRVKDKERGKMVTAPVIIDSGNNQIMRKTFMGRSWEETYKLDFKEISPTETELTIEAKINSTWSSNSEIDNEKTARMETILQETLFNLIKDELKQEGH
jgi:outer membrane lipopolysaccharide assembly protein LptE/RlpB